METIRRATCQTVLDERADGTARKPCPKCGAIIREMIVEIEETVTIHESLRAFGKRPGLGMLFDSVSGDDFGVTTQRWFSKVRLIDRGNDRYYEKVWDPETGDVIHECDEPLSQHVGHGSAKQK